MILILWVEHSSFKPDTTDMQQSAPIIISIVQGEKIVRVLLEIL